MRYLSSFLSLALFVGLAGCDAISDTDFASTSDTDSAGILATASARTAIVNQFNVGGEDASCQVSGLPTGCDANFSAHGRKNADGSVTGTHTDVVRGDDGNDNLHGTVDCLNVYDGSLGRIAVWGGEFTTGSRAGERYLSAAADGGRGGDDYISYTYIGVGDRTCENPGFGLSAFVQFRGQVRVL